jgi:NADH:ubiquinone oxidoreductase subunit 6 (subunit J)
LHSEQPKRCIPTQPHQQLTHASAAGFPEQSTAVLYPFAVVGLAVLVAIVVAIILAQRK